MSATLETDPRKFILVKGARVHNLKNIDLSIPRNKLVVFTGLSGSGKSSLAFDTIYAEGQRRYVESLSSYARQFLDRMEKPDVDYIKGLAPAIAIEQKVSTATTRSTVGTLTEIYDYLRLLYARIGQTFSPVSGEKVVKHEVSDVVNALTALAEGVRYQLLSPFCKDVVPEKHHIQTVVQAGVIRLLADSELIRLDEALDNDALIDRIKAAQERFLVIDRSVVAKDEDSIHRMSDSVQLAFDLSDGFCTIDIPGQAQLHFSTLFERDGITFDIPTPQFFNFNSPYGACPTCEGFGTILGIDEDLVIPDKTLSVYEWAVAPWKGEKLSWWRDQLIKGASAANFPIHTPVMDLSEKAYEMLWKGSSTFLGIDSFFREVEEQTYKIQYRVMLARYRGRAKCRDCNGSRLRKETQHVLVGGKHLGELLNMSITELMSWLANLQPEPHEQAIASRIFKEINHRLQFMSDVGLEYLSLNRFSNSLSGGETQRINLTRTLGSNLTGSLYILDEPSVGLHPQDTSKLVRVLKHLRDLGNTVIVVEHEEEIIRNADHLIDIGPEAGIFGGEVVYSGPLDEMSDESLTTAYLTGAREVPVPKVRRTSMHYIEVLGAKHHHLKNIDVKIPTGALTVISGVSGSGKTTLVKHILYPALKLRLENFGPKPGLHKELKIPGKLIHKVEMVDQNPIGKSSRSNPVTYIKAYDAIRDLYAGQSLSKIRGYQPRHFSFNVEGGRCEVCLGDGMVTVEMQFLADLHLTCEACRGKRFKQEVLEVRYKEKSISDVLDLSVDEAMVFFSDKPEILSRLQPLMDVGLGYVKLGQSSSTLSGGEAQRVKLASFLTKGTSRTPVCFIFDEPTTGLHFHDVNKLLTAFNALIDSGHTVIVVEHNLDVIKSADYIIDLGPIGGKDGGYLLYQGVPEGLAAVENSATGAFLKEKLS